MIRLAAAAMAENQPDEDNQRGVIINTASILASDGMEKSAAYSASKAAIVGMTLPIARDLADLGIRVVTISPGVFNTPMLASVSPDMNSCPSARNPRRNGKPEEFAHLVEAVIQNHMLNGEVIRLDAAAR
ncbi:unnamed protein product [Dicrocoelium dendriticum]|nr:unnamed protein product [Dicrocoelium dendriticum]